MPPMTGWTGMSFLLILVVVLLSVGIWLAGRRGGSKSKRKRHISSSSSSSIGNDDGVFCVEVACLDFKVDPAIVAISGLDTKSAFGEDDAGTQQQPVPNAAAITGLKTMSTTLPEAEEHIAANPASVTGQQFIGAVSDFSLRGGFNTTKYSYSVDGGNSWTQRFVPLDPATSKPTTSDLRIYDANSDPVVAFSPTGNTAYCASLYFNTTNKANGIYVAAATLPSTANHDVYTRAQVRPVIVNADPNTTVFDDKEWISVDPVTGAVYIVWTHFTATTDYILFSKSTNGAATWSTPVQVSPSAFNGAVQGAQVAADGHGNVWITWTTFYQNGIRRIYGSKSSNGGSTFGSVGFAVTPYFYGLSFPSVYRKEAFSALAVEKTSGTVHVAFPATAQTGVSKILYTRGLNGSTTFSAPINLVNTVNGNQFFPAIAADAVRPGLVQVSWFDTRNATLTGNRQLDVYTTRSTNTGVSFPGNVRVTPTTTNVGNASFVGDYCGVAVQNGKALPVFAFLVTPLQTAIVT